MECRSNTPQNHPLAPQAGSERRRRAQRACTPSGLSFCWDLAIQAGIQGHTGPDLKPQAHFPMVLPGVHAATTCR